MMCFLSLLTGVVARGGGVGSTVRLARGLDPDDGVDEGVAGRGGRANTETSTFVTRTHKLS